MILYNKGSEFSIYSFFYWLVIRAYMRLPVYLQGFLYGLIFIFLYRLEIGLGNLFMD